jgi:hypothetical protein
MRKAARFHQRLGLGGAQWATGVGISNGKSAWRRGLRILKTEVQAVWALAIPLRSVTSCE